MVSNEFKVTPGIKPGEDFYEYCGKAWMDSNPVPPDKSGFGVFDKLYEENRESMMKILGECKDPRVKGLHDSYLNKKNRHLSFDRIKTTLRDEFLNKDISVFHKNLFLESRGLGNYFPLGLDNDLHDSNKYILTLYEPELGLGAIKERYLDPQYSDLREKYLKYIRDITNVYGFSVDPEEILSLEKEISEHLMKPEDYRVVENTYHPVMVSVLRKNYSRISWDTVLSPYPVREDDYINVCNLDSLSILDKLFMDQDPRLEKALSFYFLSDTSKYSLPDLDRMSFEFFGKTMYGIPEQESLEKRAFSLVTSKFGEILAKDYLDKYFSEDSKKKIESMVENLKAAFKRRIEQQDWMSPETREKALQKLSKFSQKLGYPEKLKDYSWIPGDYNKDTPVWEIVEKINIASGNHYIQEHFGKPVDKSKWHMLPQEINAYYSPSENEICFPAGILQFPFFSPEASDAWNYGAIGVVIGHEMTHGFDDQGRKFGASGNLESWWTQEDLEKFEAKTKRLQEYFDGIEVLPGLKANGRLTLGENIADHGGLKIALEAYQGEDLKTFFIAYATLWAGKVREEHVRRRTETDPHSLGRWRVNGTLPHLQEWYDAFDITPEDPLWVEPGKRFSIW